MNRKVIAFFSVALLLASFDAFLFYKASKDDYMKERGYACKVLSKIDNQYSTHTKSGTHYSRDFMLVLSSEGKSFSLDVEPATWVICKEGATLFFTIAPYQLDYYQARPVRWGVWASLCTIVFIWAILIIAVCLFAKYENI